MRLGLRAKLLLAASALCLVPLAGYHTAQGMREMVGGTQEGATRSVARGIARILARSDPGIRATSARGEPFLYLLPLSDAPTVDGYASDWVELAPPLPLSGSILRAASYKQTVFLLAAVQVHDTPGERHLVLRMQDSPAFSRSWQISLSGHGRSAVNEIPPQGGPAAVGYADHRFAAAVGPVSGGIVVEMAFPRAQLGTGIAVTVPTPGSSTTAANESGAQIALPARGTYTLVHPRADLQARIAGLADRGRRIWIVDRHGHVLARDGELTASGTGGVVEAALNLLLPEVDDTRLTVLPASGRIEAPELTRALAGEEAQHWREATSGSERVVSAAVPVPGTRGAAHVAGAVLVEDAVSALQGLHTRALVELALATVAAFLVAGLVLLSLSARIITRLRELRDAAAMAIDGEGRVRGEFLAPAARDEIGDLSRSFGSAFERIRSYNTYLEQLARRLSHELRTPVTIVRSSLENLSLGGEVEPSGRVYLERAQDGVRRLDTMISRMTEAARLEQAVMDDERETVELTALLRACVQASGEAYPDTAVRLSHPPGELWVQVSAALIVQALEKLLANARDFHRLGTEVVVRSELDGTDVRITVYNTGPPLPSGVTDQMFDSMFSNRAGRREDEVHLGLGLYVVRLVARGHGGDAFAGNLDDGTGVGIGFTLPLCSPPSR